MIRPTATPSNGGSDSSGGNSVEATAIMILLRKV